MRRIVFRQIHSIHAQERFLALLGDLSSLRVSCVQIPWDFQGCPGFQQIFSGIKQTGAHLSWEILFSKKRFPKNLAEESVSLLLDQVPSKEDWHFLLGHARSVDRILIPLRGIWAQENSWRSLIRNAPEWALQKIQVSAKPCDLRNPTAPTAAQIHALFRKIKSKHPEARWTISRQDEEPDLLSEEVETYPVLQAEFSKQKENQKPLLSVIIPTYKQVHFLIRVLAALSKQSLSLDKYEIIVIDDGSDDGTREAVGAFFAGTPQEFQGLFLKNPRPESWSRPLPLHRAGLARNLGAQKARGEKLLFLDSDILVSFDFLEKILKASQNYDVIQCPRLHLSASTSQEFFEVPKEDTKKFETYIEEKNYWEPFFETKNWSALSSFWKYTCTYCLLVDTRLFWELGGFDRSLFTYGFEDTQLGYGAYRQGAKFHLLPTPVYHLTDENHESRFGIFSNIRHRALAASAKHFYLNHLEPEIYQQFPFLMSGPWFFQRYFWKASAFLRDRKVSAS